MEQYDEEQEIASNTLSKEAQELLDGLEENEEFNGEIESLIQGLNAGTLDLATLQSKFILLIKAILLKQNKDKTKQIEHHMREAEKDINDQLALLSHHVMMQKTPKIFEGLENVVGPKDKYESMSAAAIKSTKQLLKRFAIYEMYKVISPRIIAGETHRQHFITDYITGGMQKAMRYDHAYLEKVEERTPQMLRQLDQSHARFIRGGGMKSLGRVV